MATLGKWAINESTQKPKKKMQYNLAKTKSTMRKSKQILWVKTMGVA
jgi:hypothetical protein